MNVKYLFPMNDFFNQILANNVQGKRAVYLEREMKYALKKVKILSAIIVTAFSVFTLYPIYAYVIENRLVPMMHMEFPFVDQTKMQGFLIGVAILLFFGVLNAIGGLGTQLMVLMVLTAYESLVTQIIWDLEDYHEMWQNRERFSEPYRESFLRNICLKYHDLNRSTHYT